MHIRHRSLEHRAPARDDGRVDLDLAHIRSFLAIVRYGGYHRAAEALHLTQPAVSRHMRRLEEQLGEPLFAKRGRGVELTPFGEQAAVELGRGPRRPRPGPRAPGTRRRRREPVRPRRDREPRRPGAAGPDRGRPRAHRRARAAAAGRSLTGARERVGRGEVDAAIVVNPGDAPGAHRVRPRHAALVGRAGADRRGGGAAAPAAARRLRPAVRPARSRPAPPRRARPRAAADGREPAFSAACTPRSATGSGSRCWPPAATAYGRSPRGRSRSRSRRACGSCSPPSIAASPLPSARRCGAPRHDARWPRPPDEVRPRCDARAVWDRAGR